MCIYIYMYLKLYIVRHLVRIPIFINGFDFFRHMSRLGALNVTITQVSLLLVIVQKTFKKLLKSQPPVLFPAFFLPGRRSGRNSRAGGLRGGLVMDGSTMVSEWCGEAIYRRL